MKTSPVTDLHPEELLNALRLRPGEDVLEIGCGSGWLMEPLAV